MAAMAIKGIIVNAAAIKKTKNALVLIAISATFITAISVDIKVIRLMNRIILYTIEKTDEPFMVDTANSIQVFFEYLILSCAFSSKDSRMGLYSFACAFVILPYRA